MTSSESGVTWRRNRSGSCRLLLLRPALFHQFRKPLPSGRAHRLVLRGRLSMPGCPPFLHGFRDALAGGCAHTTPLLTRCGHRLSRFRGRPRRGDDDEVSPPSAEMAWSIRLRSVLSSESMLWISTSVLSTDVVAEDCSSRGLIQCCEGLRVTPQYCCRTVAQVCVPWPEFGRS